MLKVCYYWWNEPFVSACSDRVSLDCARGSRLAEELCGASLVSIANHTTCDHCESSHANYTTEE